ncbi:MAG: hypothetical protein AAF683_13235, partial [Pseudomonadota bacterium]
AIFTQVSSDAGGQAVTTRILSTAPSSYSFRLQEEEASSQAHVEETVDWIAFEYGTSGVIDVIDAGGVDEAWATVNYDPIAGTVGLFASMQTFNGPDPATVRARNIGVESAEIFVHEEKSLDVELDHGFEDIAVVAAAEGVYELLLA